jgi:Rrf2 family protein
MLRLSTRARYSVRIMVRLAMRHGTEPATKQQIAEAEGMSADYVEQILMKLRTGGLALSHRGKRGGFSLAKDPGGISVGHVLEAVDGPLALTPCAAGDCRRATQCVTRPVWQRAEKALNDVFASATIKALANEARAREAEDAVSFEI